ncbi:succinylglutamate desuccinylase/aspartoacylase family protein [Vibrio sp.]|nr:succinylglutamate desuccinylase/aspartoacylase family protein [Vibrio sp.]
MTLITQKLAVNALPSGVHKQYFQAMTDAIGQAVLIPLWVFKGEEDRIPLDRNSVEKEKNKEKGQYKEKTSQRVVITAGLHGDEMNGVLTAQAIVRELHGYHAKGGQIHGTIMIVPILNPKGVLSHSRRFVCSDHEQPSQDLNRLFPGKAAGNSAERFTNAIWTNLLQGNADIAIDLHTQTMGASYPLYAFSDYRIPQCKALAKQIGADVILDDPGEKGVLETEWNQQGVPAITLEIGAGKVIDKALIERSQRGLLNLLHRQGILPDYVPPKESDVRCRPIEGKKTLTMRAEEGGFCIPCVELLQKVAAGDLISIQYNDFGEEIKRYIAPKSGVVISINTDPIRDFGGLIGRLLID